MGKKRKTHEEFVKELKKTNQNLDNITFLTKYNGIKNNVNCKCNKCNYEWITTAEILKMGCGCPVCGKEKISKALKRSLDDFLIELYSKRNDIKYVSNYEGMKKICVFKCIKHNKLIKTTPQSILKGTMCPICRKDKSQYNKLSKEQINDLILPLKLTMVGDYVNSKTPTTFKCQLCGKEFISKYEVVKYRKSIGCNECAKIINPNSKRETLNRRIEKLKLNKSKNIQIVEYDDNCQQIKCECLLCKEIYTTSYASVIKGCIHKKCAAIIGLSHLRQSENEIINKIKSFENDIKIDFSNYFSSSSLLTCTCNVCGHVWKAKQKNLTKGRGCPVCAQKRRDISKYKPIDCYFNLLNDMHLSVVSKYVNASTPVSLKCNICGNEFESTMQYLSNCHVGCKKCSQESTRINKKKNFISNLSKINPTIKLVGDFMDMSTSSEFLCTQCNKKFKRTPHDLLKSCNCPNCTTNSKMEYWIMTYLNEKNIDFELHKTYVGLKGVNDGLLSYDFYLPKYNLLIEAQGQQHAHPIDCFGGEEQFKIQQEHDRRKRDYANEHNIKLLEIWYWDFDNIEKILDKQFYENIRKVG